MAFKMKSGSPFQRNFDVGSSPMKTHNTGYDDQYRLIRLPDVTDREKKEHQSSVEMRSNLSEEELLKEKAIDKEIREYEEKKQGYQDWLKEVEEKKQKHKRIMEKQKIERMKKRAMKLRENKGLLGRAIGTIDDYLVKPIVGR